MLQQHKLEQCLKFWVPGVVCKPFSTAHCDSTDAIFVFICTPFACYCRVQYCLL